MTQHRMLEEEKQDYINTADALISFLSRLKDGLRSENFSENVGARQSVMTLSKYMMKKFPEDVQKNINKVII